MLAQFFAGSLLFQAIASLPLGKRAAQITRLVVFGDSFSDDGNGSWIASNMTWPADPAYFEHHFSNGYVWAQDVAQDLNLTLLDYGAGGSTSDNAIVQGFTGPNETIPVPSAVDQITNFLSNDTVQPNDVYVVYIGANDALFSTNITGGEIAGVIEGQVHRLVNLGAQNILLADYPSLSTVPAAYGLPAAETAFLSTYSTDLRNGLSNIVAGWSPYINLAKVDIYDLFANITAHPADYGINASYINPPTACLQGVEVTSVPRSLCSDPSAHLFFDDYHPVKEVHKLMAELFEDAIRMW